MKNLKSTTLEPRTLREVDNQVQYRPLIDRDVDFIGNVGTEEEPRKEPVTIGSGVGFGRSTGGRAERNQVRDGPPESDVISSKFLRVGLYRIRTNFWCSLNSDCTPKGRRGSGNDPMIRETGGA